MLSSKWFSSILSGPPLTCVTSEKAEAEIPAGRRQLWNRLRQNGFVEVEYVRPGARSGAIIRDHQARLGDVLLVLGGGSGVEHLTDQFLSRRLPVIAFDLPLGASRDDGTGGGLKIARETKADPSTYFRLRSEHQASAGSMYSLLSTRGGAESAESVSEHALQLMEKTGAADGLLHSARQSSDRKLPKGRTFFPKGRRSITAHDVTSGSGRVMMTSIGLAWSKSASVQLDSPLRWIREITVCTKPLRKIRLSAIITKSLTLNHRKSATRSGSISQSFRASQK